MSNENFLERSVQPFKPHSLDVGCGETPMGEVNCDLFQQKAKNMVVCHCEHLPFKNKAFPLVTCNHVIEHTPNPTQPN